MATVRILHASDLHIAENKKMRSPVDKFSDLYGLRNLNLITLSQLVYETFRVFRKKISASSYDPELLECLAEFIYHSAKKKLAEGTVLIEDDPEKIDAVILTGDLATTGGPKDIGKVKNFLTAAFDPKCPYRSLGHEATLAAVKIPVWYFPGNHDRLVPTHDLVRIKGLLFPKFFEPGGTEFDKELLDFQREPVRVLGEVPTSSAEGLSLRVVMIAADFNLKQFGDHEGIYGWLAQGKVYDDILGQLIHKTEEEVTKHKESGAGAICLIWAIHFPPAFPQISKANRLIAEENLIRSAKLCGVRAILAGHTHEQVSYRKPGMDFDILCCGSTTQYEPFLGPNGSNISGGNRFQIIVVTADTSENISINIENYKYKRVGEDKVNIAYFYKEP